MATLPTGILDYLESPITTVEPPHFRFIDLTTLIHSVVNTDHPHITKPFNVHYQDEQTESHFDMNHIHRFEDPMTNNTIFIVQPSQILAPRRFLLLQYCKENLQVLNKFHSQNFNLKIFEDFKHFENSFRLKTVLIPIVMVSGKNVLYFGLDWN